MKPDINIDATVLSMANELEQLTSKDCYIIGIHTGGVWIAEKLQNHMQLDTPPGELNINFYRDDFSQIGLHPRILPSKIPFRVDQKTVILVDDVLHTGRTIRAALNEIFDFGRPARVLLAVLVERSGRELPISADVVGKRISLNANEHVKLSGPEPLSLEIKTVE